MRRHMGQAWVHPPGDHRALIVWHGRCAWGMGGGAWAVDLQRARSRFGACVYCMVLAFVGVAEGLGEHVATCIVVMGVAGQGLRVRAGHLEAHVFRCDACQRMSAPMFACLLIVRPRYRFGRRYRERLSRCGPLAGRQRNVASCSHGLRFIWYVRVVCDPWPSSCLAPLWAVSLIPPLAKPLAGSW